MEKHSFSASCFGQFLLNNHIIPPGKESFFVHWVRLFFQKKENWPDYPWNQQLEFFIKLLQNQGQLKDWQIRQADQAVRLYFVNYLTEKTGIDLNDKPMITIDHNGCFARSSAMQLFKETMRLRNYSYRTEQTYSHWINRFFNFIQENNLSLNKEHIFADEDQVRNFLAYLAVTQKVSASTQNQAFNSLLLFFRQILCKDLGDLKNAVRAQTGKRLPVVFSVEEVKNLFEQVTGTTNLILN